jgi:DNA modification methylase
LIRGAEAERRAWPPSTAIGETRNRRSVWTIPVRSFEGAHFATFPEEIPRICILSGSRPGDTVLDPFNGAATTGVVALKTGRHYIGCELNPEYVGISLRRLRQVDPLFAQEVA